MLAGLHVLQFKARYEFEFARRNAGFGWLLGQFLVLRPADLQALQRLVPAAENEVAKPGGGSDNFVRTPESVTISDVARTMGYQRDQGDADAVSVAPIVSVDTTRKLSLGSRLSFANLRQSAFVNDKDELKLVFEITRVGRQ